MPNTPPRRRLTRHTAPPRPTFEHDSASPSGAASSRQVLESQRVAGNAARQVPYLVAELKRVLGVTVVCFGILAVLMVVDRLQ